MKNAQEVKGSGTPAKDFAYQIRKPPVQNYTVASSRNFFHHGFSLFEKEDRVYLPGRDAYTVEEQLD